MPTIAEVLEQALAHHRAGRLQFAEQLYQQILQADPNCADALHLMGVLAYQQSEPDLAVELLCRAIAINPADAAFHSNLALAYLAHERFDEAAASCRQALKLQPHRAGAHHNLGLALAGQGKLQEAIVSYSRALEFDPNNAEVHNCLGIAYSDQGNMAEAAASYKRALELQSDNVHALNNLGAALYECQDLESARMCYQRALELNPDFAWGHNGLGGVLREEGRFGEASACFHRALELRSDYADARLNQAFLHLLHGRLEVAWPEYEWRWRVGLDAAARDRFQPRWDGRALADLTILLHAEQGLGDTLQAVRYAPQVKQRVGKVILECQRELKALLCGADGIDTVVAQGESLPSFDEHVPLMSLPGVFGTRVETIPADVPYLQPNDDLVRRWHMELSVQSGCKIGIVWQGNPANKRDRIRSFSANWFAPLASLPTVQLYSLQVGIGRHENAAADFPVIDLGERLTDFGDTAAVIQHLDLVITCDTAVAHLAGALGRPVWVALPFVPDWRWLLDRDDSPWYPTMRLFRQRQRGDWSSVFQEIEHALRQLIKERERPV